MGSKIRTKSGKLKYKPGSKPGKKKVKSGAKKEVRVTKVVAVEKKAMGMSTTSIILIILAVILLGVGGYLLWKYAFGDSTTSTPSATGTVSPASCNCNATGRRRQFK